MVVINNEEVKYYDVVIACTGVLSKPFTPKIPGDDSYDGLSLFLSKFFI